MAGARCPALPGGRPDIIGHVTESATRLPLPDQLVARRIACLLPDCDLGSVIAPVEVLIQEGLDVVSLPASGTLTSAELKSVFGPRLAIGVHDVRDEASLRWALRQDPLFVTSIGFRQATRALSESRVPHLPAALTPTEIADAWHQGVAGVQVVPSGLFGNTYPAQLTALLPDVVLVARGPDSTYDVKAWLGAGAAAVLLGNRLLGDSITGGDLGALRARTRPIVDAR